MIQNNPLAQRRGAERRFAYAGILLFLYLPLHLYGKIEVLLNDGIHRLFITIL